MVVTDRDTVVPAPALLRRVSWGAIFAGAVIAVALTALLGLLGIGIGLGTLDIAQGDSVEGAPKATLIWWAATSIIATGIGGFIAARLAGIPRGLTGALHGFAVWAVTSLLVLWLATTAVGFALGAATNVVTTTARATSGAVTTAGGAAIDAGGAVIPSPRSSDVDTARDRARQEAQVILDRAGVGEQSARQAQDALATAARHIALEPGSAGEEINRLIDRLFQGPNAALSPQERDRLVTALAERGGLSREEAEQAASRWEAQASAAWTNVERTGRDVGDRAGETAVDVADTAVDTLSKVAWGMFLISLAGLVAALIGAALGGASLGLGLIAAGATAAAVREGDEYQERNS